MQYGWDWSGPCSFWAFWVLLLTCRFLSLFPFSFVGPVAQIIGITTLVLLLPLYNIHSFTQTRFPAYCFILLQYHHRQPLPPAPPPPNCNNSIHNANYVGAAEMANMTLVPPPPPGFVVNPPVASHQRQQQTRHQQNFNSSPLPHGLIASETNFWVVVYMKLSHGILVPSKFDWFSSS